MTDITSDLLSLRLQRLYRDIQSAGGRALESFWAEIEQHGSPIIEPGANGDSLVTFLWKDDGLARQVAVIQDWGADGIREHHMTCLPGSDVWYVTRRMRDNTRTTYQLSPNPSDNRDQPAPYQPDPLNPRTFTAFFSETGNDILFSLLELPGAPALPWRQTHSIPAGRIELHQPFDDRRLWVYLPAAQTTSPLPLLVVFDGVPYKDRLHLPEMLDYLIAERKIPPVAALLIDNRDRSELLCRSEFADHMANKVIPWLRNTYTITDDPHETVVIGSSYGGLGAAFLAFKHPQIFGAVLSQTGWFRWHPEDEPEHHWLARQMAEHARVQVMFWLQVGNLEVALMLDGGPSQLAANEYMRDTLRAKRYQVSYQEYSGGHDLSSLESPLAGALTDILNRA
jgi:Enterochelin esterase and related enzymes